MRLFTLNDIVIVVDSAHEAQLFFFSHFQKIIKALFTNHTKILTKSRKAYILIVWCDYNEVGNNDDDKRVGNNYFYLAYYSVSNKIRARVVVENFLCHKNILKILRNEVISSCIRQCNSFIVSCFMPARLFRV